MGKPQREIYFFLMSAEATASAGRSIGYIFDAIINGLPYDSLCQHQARRSIHFLVFPFRVPEKILG